MCIYSSIRSNHIMLKFRDLIMQGEDNTNNPNIDYQYIDIMIESDDIDGVYEYVESLYIVQYMHKYNEIYNHIKTKDNIFFAFFVLSKMKTSGYIVGKYLHRDEIKSMFNEATQCVKQNYGRFAFCYRSIILKSILWEAQNNDDLDQQVDKFTSVVFTNKKIIMYFLKEMFRIPNINNLFVAMWLKRLARNTELQYFKMAIDWFINICSVYKVIDIVEAYIRQYLKKQELFQQSKYLLTKAFNVYVKNNHNGYLRNEVIEFIMYHHNKDTSQLIKLLQQHFNTQTELIDFYDTCFYTMYHIIQDFGKYKKIVPKYLFDVCYNKIIDTFEYYSYNRRIIHKFISNFSATTYGEDVFHKFLKYMKKHNIDIYNKFISTIQNEEKILNSNSYSFMMKYNKKYPPINIKGYDLF